jgi:hypothetical protein
MKPVFLVFFFLIVFSAIVFAGIYVFYQRVVETNPLVFSAGLVTIVVVGMFGMINSIVSDTRTVVERTYGSR